jgi:uncharacterized protein (DUF2267 family)
MSTSTGVTALDHSAQETNVWLKAIDEQLALENRHQAYNALRAVLHALRDRMPPEVAVKLGAQLPILVRGIYYARAVYEVLWEKLDPGEFEKLMAHLPAPLRNLQG